jgi:hypothetical protein
MNLVPISVEHTHGDGARRPINLGHERNCADRVPGVGGGFANDVCMPVEKLD